VIYSHDQRYLWLYAKYAIRRCSQQIVAGKIKGASLMGWRLYGQNITSKDFRPDAMIAMSS